MLEGKSEIGKISKTIIAGINSKLKELRPINQWKDTSAVIDWFEGINDKRNCMFIQFDIAEFYPSISKELLTKSIDHAKKLHYH